MATEEMSVSQGCQSGFGVHAGGEVDESEASRFVVELARQSDRLDLTMCAEDKWTVRKSARPVREQSDNSPEELSEILACNLERDVFDKQLSALRAR